MAFFKKLKDRLFKSSSKIDEGLGAIVNDGGVEAAPELTPNPVPTAPLMPVPTPASKPVAAPDPGPASSPEPPVPASEAKSAPLTKAKPEDQLSTIRASCPQQVLALVRLQVDKCRCQLARGPSYACCRGAKQLDEVRQGHLLD